LVEGVDERGFTVLRRLRASRPESRRMTLPRFKQLLREQYMIMRHDPERAVAAIPYLLAEHASADERSEALDALHQIAEAGGEVPAEVKQRLSRIEALFAAVPAPSAPAEWHVAAAAAAAPTSETKAAQVSERIPQGERR
jgi:hypothetical protein